MSASEGNGPIAAGTSASQSDLDRIVTAIDSSTEVEKLLRVKAAYIAPDDLLVAAKITLVSDRRASEAAADIEAIKERIREAVPQALTIFIEPDIYRPAIDPAPPTDVFVLKSED